jgi:hypothetical protein
MPLLDDPYRKTPSLGLLAQPLPMRLPYGQRWNQETGKLDSPESKGIGFYGPLTNMGDHIVSEYSVDDRINGKPVQYPTVAPGMSPEQIRRLLQTEHLQSLQPGGSSVPMPHDIADLAYESAKGRVSQGQSPFFDPRIDPYPQWSPEQQWPSPYGLLPLGMGGFDFGQQEQK